MSGDASGQPDLQREMALPPIPVAFLSRPPDRVHLDLDPAAGHRERGADGRVGRTGRLTQPLGNKRGRDVVWVARLRHDPQTAVLRDWTRRPSVPNVLPHPVPGGVMVNVFGIQQRTQDIHVQQ